MNLVFKTYSASMAENITGVTPINQRIWWSRGFFGTRDRQSGRGFTTKELMQLMLINDLHEATHARLSRCASLAYLAVLPALRHALFQEGMVAIPAGFNGSIDPLVNNATVEFKANFAVVTGKNSKVRFVDSLSSIFDGNVSMCIYVDLSHAGEKLAKRVGSPIGIISERTIHLVQSEAKVTA